METQVQINEWESHTLNEKETADDEGELRMVVAMLAQY